MKTTCYVVFSKNGVIGTRRGRPSLRSGEFAFRLTVEVPDRYFAAETPDVSVLVPDRAIITPTVTVDVPEEAQHG